MRSTRSLYVCLFLLLGVSSQAHAYGDPAAGAFVIQAVVAGALAGIAVLKSQLWRIKSTLALRQKASVSKNNHE